MNDENNNSAKENTEISKNDMIDINIADKNQTSNDISKIKIRTILKERFKKSRPGFKKVIPFILVGIICFAAGVGLDRILLKHKISRGIIGRPNIQQNYPKNRFNNRQGNGQNNPNTPDRFNGNKR